MEHFFIMKIPEENSNIEKSNYLTDISFKDLMKLYKD